jgi:hypothetical protein
MFQYYSEEIVLRFGKMIFTPITLQAAILGLANRAGQRGPVWVDLSRT